MKISIVTPSFNQGEFIEETIRSVLRQDHEDLEHIIIDGGSTDSTRSVLSRYSHLKWISEKDAGQADAVNKGLRRATGDILGWINSDDYYEPLVFGAVAAYFSAHPDCMVLYGDITYVDRNGSFIVSYSGDTINYESLIRSPDIVRQPSFFWRKEALEEVGTLDERFHLVMDFDFFLRLAREFPFHYIGLNLSYFRTYRENKTNTFRFRQIQELSRVFRKQKIAFGPAQAKFFIMKFFDMLGMGAAIRSMVRLMRAAAKS